MGFTFVTPESVGVLSSSSKIESFIFLQGTGVVGVSKPLDISLKSDKWVWCAGIAVAGDAMVITNIIKRKIIFKFNLIYVENP